MRLAKKRGARMPKRVSIIFPYRNSRHPVVRENLTKVMENCVGERGEQWRWHKSIRKPVLVVNRDSMRRNPNEYEDFSSYLDCLGKRELLDRLDVVEVWSVDTCQMWLAGFGKIVDDEETAQKSKDGGRNGQPENSAQNPLVVLQVPGDLKRIGQFERFERALYNLGRQVDDETRPLAIGDFVVRHENSKHLIDTYGTYPLLFNWFPEVAAKLKSFGIDRPRSEFIAVSFGFLKEALRKKKFAYEQTIALLIYALATEGKWTVGEESVGEIDDEGTERGFREAVDQIERTERVLKVLWREMKGKGASTGDGNEFEFDIDQFEDRDRRSTAIREAALVYLANVLKVRRQDSGPKPPSGTP
jgi:hypothetical protein